jgi:FG-GAP repeat protein
MRGRLALALLLVPFAIPAPALAQQYQSARLHTAVLDQFFQYAESVAISGDWAIAGSRKFTPADGSVFFYQRGPQGWVFRQEVLNPIKDSGQLPIDLFGVDVAIDGNLALVGARLAGNNDGGLLLVYELQGSKWVKVDELEASDPQHKAGFGFAFALSEERIAVSAPFSSHPSHEDGAVYVFDRAPAGWIQTVKLLAPPQTIPFQYDAVALFGLSVDLAGKWLVVGAPGSPNNGLGGAAFVYNETSTGWKLNGALVDTLNPTYDDMTGKSVAISEDGQTVLAGSPQFAGGSGAHPGSVLVFERGLIAAGEWALSAELKASDGSVFNGVGDQFGESVAIQGDLAVIGAPFANGNAPHAGAAYLFERIGAGWAERERLFHSPAPTNHQELGMSVSIDGPFVLVGDKHAWIDGVETGAAFVFELGIGDPYCPAVSNSTGSPAVLAALGSAVVADRRLLLSVHDAPAGTFGLFFFGPTQVQLPLGGGTLCVGGQLERLAPVAITGDSGATMHTVDFSDSVVTTNLLEGSTWNFQMWFRDKAGGPVGSNLSNAVELVFQ